ncbi:DeoR family transcriptional regulator [Paraburkholderia bryophila]|uniref:Putative DNA-binding transcriptional regulator YafY n=1 Tax=Paraburkholderia bryophila TaxID=420952 RepID=A0A7Z0B7L4_9BURK|nr:DeoR family transcriptional regulator [Paraburkholderia bryophila]NYH22462.1 putative DNA-binding transcriptional regulator YafY [Paraburkholderia bryophila]
MRRAHPDRIRPGSRIETILKSFITSGQVNVAELALLFHVSTKTIRRDIKGTLGFLHPEPTHDGGYRIDARHLNILTSRDLEFFVEQAGIAGLFPVGGMSLFRRLHDGTLKRAYAIQGIRFEDMAQKRPFFAALERAIEKRFIVDVRHANTAFQGFSPYKLVNHVGTWFVVGVHGARLKALSMATIESISATAQSYEYDDAISSQILHDPTLYESTGNVSVELRISSTMAEALAGTSPDKSGEWIPAHVRVKK